MPIDVDKALGAELPAGVSQWDNTDVILYHLGVGAGVPPTDERELEYTYEQRLKVLPSFGVIPVFSILGGMIGVEGMSFNPMMLLHGEQDITLHKPLPVQAKVESSGKIVGVYDKGKGATVVIEATTKDEQGEPLCTNVFTAFIRGEGGFGGESGPQPGNEAPDRAPDLVVESATLPQQALLYRLSGDRNPLHIDPAMAALGGFDTPILHGLCSYGIGCKTIVDTFLDGDVSRVGSYGARFAGVVFPGETLKASIWKENDKFVAVLTAPSRDDAVVLSGVELIPV
jgi:acyl dehydratase